MSIIVTMYEDLSDYISAQFATLREPVTPYQEPRMLSRNRLGEDTMLTRLYEQMEQGLLIPYNLFPKNKTVNKQSLQYTPHYLSSINEPHGHLNIDLGV
mgnify:CR=1 FL=1|jgi:hypothetical protein